MGKKIVKPQTNKALKKLMCSELPKAPTAQEIMNSYRDEALMLPQCMRQAFIDAMWSGKTIGEARELLGITFEASMGIMDLNLTQCLTLRTESV